MNNIVPDELFLTIIANEVIDLSHNLYTYYNDVIQYTL